MCWRICILCDLKAINKASRFEERTIIDMCELRLLQRLPRLGKETSSGLKPTHRRVDLHPAIRTSQAAS